MSDGNVIVRLKGGLGNQLFQYAAGSALAHRLDAPLLLDLTYCRQDPLRDYALDAYGVPEAIASRSQVAAFAPDSGLRRTLAKRTGLPGLFLKKGLFVEPHFHVTPKFETLRAPVFLDGYWQSEKYFSEISDSLREMFSVPLSMPPAVAELRQKIADIPVAISVHVRRGDYITGKSASKMAGSCTPDYYRRAVTHMLAIYPGATFVVFSDEPAYANALLEFAPDRILADGDPEEPANDLALMAVCNHHIIANSSFSWWGAWLNPDARKTVIAPRLWFSPDYLAKTRTHDLYPEGWLSLA